MVGNHPVGDIVQFSFAKTGDDFGVMPGDSTRLAFRGPRVFEGSGHNFRSYFRLKIVECSSLTVHISKNQMAMDFGGLGVFTIFSVGENHERPLAVGIEFEAHRMRGLKYGCLGRNKSWVAGYVMQCGKCRAAISEYNHVGNGGGQIASGCVSNFQNL